LVLFAEGTSTDGNRVLPFQSSLFAAAKPVGKTREAGALPEYPAAVVQSVSIVYARLHGIPLGRADRPLVGWYGDMDMTSHAWELLKSGPLDVLIRISNPIPLSEYRSRKDLAEQTEAVVREGVVRTLRGRSQGETLVTAKQSKASVRVRRPHRESETWR
jgi:1-acyl-sn-glycerol-3-phosphate acyltransferase